MTAPPKVVAGFVSFTEVDEGHHGTYNTWHLYDHLPEQLPLPGIAWGQRWVLTPELSQSSTTKPPLDRVHYVTLYLLAEPLGQTLEAFRALGQRLRAADRFHLHRRSHLSGAMEVSSMAAAPRALVSAEAVPYRPSTGAHVRLTREAAPPAASLLTVPGVAGAWTFTGMDMHLTWCWLDDDPIAAGEAITSTAPAPPGALFDATLHTIDPRGPWDWFDC
jgi:hypothetical protein